MTRYLPQWLSPVVESLELDRPELLTMAELCAIADEAGVKAPGYTIADRLRRLGRPVLHCRPPSLSEGIRPFPSRL